MSVSKARAVVVLAEDGNADLVMLSRLLLVFHLSSVLIVFLPIMIYPE